MKKQWYMQHTACVGDCALFWRKDAKGYTTNLDEAHVYDEQPTPHRDEDVPRLRSEVDALVLRHVNRDALAPVQGPRHLPIPRHLEWEDGAGLARRCFK